MVMGASMVLIRIEYVATRMMFEKLDEETVASILAGERDAEVLAWDQK
jgi:hypothetical protein